MCADNRELAKRELSEYRSKKRALRETAEKATERVARARDAVAKAQKALAALDKDRD